MDDDLIAAFKPDDEKFSPARCGVKGLSPEAAAKFVGGRVGDDFRASDGDTFYRKPLYLRSDYPFYRLYFRQFRHGINHLSSLIF